VLGKCKDCKAWEKNEFSELGGRCLHSMHDNKLMVARDDIAAYDPFLETSPEFGCLAFTKK